MGSWDLRLKINETFNERYILSVLLLAGAEVSVVTTHVWDPLSHGPPPL